MTKDLLHILINSEKRKDTLLLLSESPRPLSELKEYFKVTSPELLPRLRELEALELIFRHDGKYCITPLGEAIATQYKPFLDTLQAIESNMDFLKDHDISSIPKELLCRIAELKNCRVHKIEYSFESHPDFVKHIIQSKHFVGVASIFIPSWPKMFLELAKKGVEISIVVTESVYKIIKDQYPDMLEDGLKFKNASMFLFHGKADISFVSTDKFLSLSLVSKNSGIYDPCSDLMGFDHGAKKWGMDLFNYYKENSIEIKSTSPINESIMHKIYPESMLFQ